MSGKLGKMRDLSLFGLCWNLLALSGACSALVKRYSALCGLDFLNHDVA